MKKLISLIIVVIVVMIGVTASAEQIDMYVNNTYVLREFSTIGQFDMVPILDIAGELGYSASLDDQNFQISNDETTYYFTVGSANVYAHDGTWFGLDIVPTIINGRIMIPSNFLIYNMGVTYSWDDITSTLFINSDYTYKWLINTPEYQKEKTRRKENATIKQKGTQQTTVNKAANLGYGQVKGLITWKYNKVLGTRGDDGAKIMLIPNNYNVKKYDNKTAAMFISGKYESGILVTKCDGYGNFDFGDRVPAGEYKALVISNNTTAAERFTYPDKWEKSIEDEFGKYFSNEDLKTLKLFIGYNSYASSIICVENGHCNTLTKDFGYTYI